MSVRRFGPSLGAGVVVIEQEAQKLIDPAPLGVTLYMTPLERGPLGKIITTYSKSDMLSQCGRRIAGFDGMDCAQDFWEHSNGAGELHFIRIAKSTARVASFDFYSREASLSSSSRPALRLEAFSPGRWGSTKRTIWRQTSLLGDIGTASIATGLAMLQDEWASGAVALDGVPSKEYTIISNTTNGVVTVRTDANMAADLAAGNSPTDKGYTLILRTPVGPEGLKRAISIRIDDGEIDANNEFSITVYVHGEMQKRWGSLSMDPTSAHYFVRMINDDPSNQEIVATDLMSPNDPSPPSVRPTNEQGVISAITATTLASLLLSIGRATPIGGTVPNPTLALGSTSDAHKYRDIIRFTCESLSASPATAGTSTGGAGPFLVRPAQKIDVSIDQAASESYVFGGTRGRKDGAGAPFVGTNGGGNDGTITLRRDEDALTDQVITFTGVAAGLAAALQSFNDQWIGGNAISNAGQVRLQSDRYGTGSAVRIVAGTANLLTDLGLAIGATTSVGTATMNKSGGGAQSFACIFLDAMTRAEFLLAIAATSQPTGGAGGVFSNTGSLLQLVSNTTGISPKGVQIKNTSTAALVGSTSLGFDFVEHNGVAAVAGGQATLSMKSMLLGGAVLAHANVTANNSQGANYAFTSPTSPLVPPITITCGSVVFAAGDYIEADYRPFEPNSLKGGLLIPDITNSPGTRFAITANDHQTITCASGGLIDVGSGDVSDKFMVVFQQEMGGVDRAGGTATNGYDGLAGLSDNDYTLALSASDSPARDLLSENKGLVKVACPDRTSAAIAKAGLAFAEAMNWQYRVEIPDNITTEVAAIAHINTTVGRSDFGVTSFPSYCDVGDPDKPGLLKRIPMTGMIHGMEALTAKNSGGYHKPAAGTDHVLRRVVTLPTGTRRLNEEALNPMGVNVVKKSKGNTIIWGARTISVDSGWMWKNQREQMSHYENRLREGYDFVIFMLNERNLWATLLTTLRAMFLPEFQLGALKGSKFEDAVSLKIDAENNTNLDAENGELFADIKLRLATPVERFVIRIGKAGVFESLSS